MNATAEAERGDGTLSVSNVKVRLVDDSVDDLVGWASCVVDGVLFLNNIAVRRTREGELILVYPRKKSRRDQKYYLFKPITEAARDALKTAILGKLQGLIRHGG